MPLASEILVYLFIFLLIWIFALYPLFLKFLYIFLQKPLNKDLSYQPAITIILSLYNEEHYVEDCINSIFNSVYPADKIKLLAGSDGSDDKTIDKLNELKEIYPNIEIFDLPRSGKNSVLNYLIPLAETDLVFFMDADLRLRNDSLPKLVANLSDEKVGCTLASLNILGESSDSNSGKKGEQSYQNWESIIRKYESSIYTTVNNLGTLHGSKKAMLKPIPDNLVCDDFYILLSTVDSGQRAYYDHDAVVDEVRKKSLSGEMKRRIRLVGGGISTLMRFKKLLFFQRGISSFFIWNHKVLRWLTPLFTLYFLIAPLLLNDGWLREALIYFNLALYASAFIGWLTENLRIKYNIFKVPLFFISMNIGFLLGIIRFIRRGNNAVWERLDTKK